MTRFLSSYKMIVLMGLTPALGYIATGPISRPAPFVVVSSKPTTDETFRPSWFVHPPNVLMVEEQAKPQKVSYDLGLGKNQPVYGGKRIAYDAAADNIDQVVRHMVQHESARPYPSPLLAVKKEEQAAPAALVPLPNKKKRLPKVQLERKAQDVLKIWRSNSMESSSLPTMVGKHQHVDLNTVWVEMLIHNQQEEQERHDQQQQLAMVSV
jgi:hypothetical protein